MERTSSKRLFESNKQRPMERAMRDQEEELLAAEAEA